MLSSGTVGSDLKADVLKAIDVIIDKGRYTYKDDTQMSVEFDNVANSLIDFFIARVKTENVDDSEKYGQSKTNIFLLRISYVTDIIL